MRTDFQISTQIKLMNQMLDYLGYNSYSFYRNGNYKKIYLRYSKKTSRMQKREISWNYRGEKKESGWREKSIGGYNGDDMFNQIKIAAIEKAKKTNNKKPLLELERNNVEVHFLDI